MYPYFQNPYMYQNPYVPQAPRVQMNQNVCEMVGDIETVKAAQLDMSGQPRFYPRSDGAAVYRKQLMPDGTSRIVTYTLSKEGDISESQRQDDTIMDTLNTLNDKMDAISAQIQAINSLWGGTANE